ncbi:MAG: hypothetical protein AAB701_02920 [Patescibacteria group bacterium]|mgnify:CR=1 FL=1
MTKKPLVVTNEDLAGKIDALAATVSGLPGTIAKSIEDLAGMTQRGFTEVGERFDRVEGRLDRVETRLEGVEDGLKKVKTEVSHLGFIVTELVRRDEFLELKQRVQVLESQLAKK